MLDLAASTSQMGRFETGAMTSTQNLTALADVSGRSAAPAGGPTCVRGMPCTARQGQEEPWHPASAARPTRIRLQATRNRLPSGPQEGQRPIRRGVPPRLPGNVGLSVFGGLMCAACADNSARVPEYRQPPSRRVDDLVCPQPPPRYRAAPSHGAQSSHGGSSSTGVRVAGARSSGVSSGASGHRAFGALTKREAAEARGTEYGMTVAPLGISARKDALMPNKVDRQRRTNVRS